MVGAHASRQQLLVWKIVVYGSLATRLCLRSQAPGSFRTLGAKDSAILPIWAKTGGGAGGWCAICHQAGSRHRRVLRDNTGHVGSDVQASVGLARVRPADLARGAGGADADHPVVRAVTVLTIDVLLVEIAAADFSGTGAAMGTVTQTGQIVTVVVIAGAGATITFAARGARTIRDEFGARLVVRLRLELVESGSAASGTSGDDFGEFGDPRTRRRGGAPAATTPVRQRFRDRRGGMRRDVVAFEQIGQNLVADNVSRGEHVDCAVALVAIGHGSRAARLHIHMQPNNIEELAFEVGIVVNLENLDPPRLEIVIGPDLGGGALADPNPRDYLLCEPTTPAPQHLRVDSAPSRDLLIDHPISGPQQRACPNYSSLRQRRRSSHPLKPRTKRARTSMSKATSEGSRSAMLSAHDVAMPACARTSSQSAWTHTNRPAALGAGATVVNDVPEG